MNYPLPTSWRALQTLRDGLQQARRHGLRPVSRLDLVEWADERRYLSPESSAEVGRWQTSRVEVARGPMLAVTDPDVRTVTVMACTQLLKTELINNTVGYYIDQEPAPIMVIEPTLTLAEAWSTDRLAPMLRDTPVLQDKVAPARSRDAGNKLLYKRFPGGHVTMAGANSPASLGMRPVRVVVFDEVDKYPTSAGEEGDPIKLAEQRASTFATRKFIRVCSPTVKGASRIEASYLESDQRRFYTPCPHCGHRQTLTWKHVHWTKDQPATAAIHCAACGAAWSERERLAALQWSTWRQTAPFTCCDDAQDPRVNAAGNARADPPVDALGDGAWDAEGRSLCRHCGQRSAFNGHAGFHANRLHSPWEALPEVVARFLIAKARPDTLRVFSNTDLAETWEETGEGVDEDSLAARAVEDWYDLVPAGVLVMTAGVDVQGDRLEAELVGWGVGFESWSIEHRVFWGDPAGDAVWSDLDAWLRQPRQSAGGWPLVVQAAFVDSGGHHTQAVYRFAAPRAKRRVFAIKGVSARGKDGRRPVWKWSKAGYTGGKLVLVGTDAAKDDLFAWLAVEHPGPGYCHFPAGRDEAWFQQLTAEVAVTKYDRGVAYRVWVNRPGRRNEALDCRVYAYAALVSLNVNWTLLAAHKRQPGLPLGGAQQDADHSTTQGAQQDARTKNLAAHADESQPGEPGSPGGSPAEVEIPARVPEKPVPAPEVERPAARPMPRPAVRRPVRQVFASPFVG